MIVNIYSKFPVFLPFEVFAWNVFALSKSCLFSTDCWLLLEIQTFIPLVVFFPGLFQKQLVLSYHGFSSVLSNQRFAPTATPPTPLSTRPMLLIWFIIIMWWLVPASYLLHKIPTWLNPSCAYHKETDRYELSHPAHLQKALYHFRHCPASNLHVHTFNCLFTSFVPHDLIAHRAIIFRSGFSKYLNWSNLSPYVTIFFTLFHCSKVCSFLCEKDEWYSWGT